MPFAGSKFSEMVEGPHEAFVVDNLEGSTQFETRNLSLSITLQTPRALIGQSVVKSGTDEFTFNAGDTTWTATGTPDPGNKLSFTVNGNVLEIGNNGSTNLPADALLFEIKAIPRGTHLNMVVSIAYAQGCPPLVGNAITPLVFSGLCGACNTKELQIGYPAEDRSSLDGFSNYYTLDYSNMCFASDGLLTTVEFYAKRSSSFQIAIFEQISAFVWRIVGYPVNDTAVSGQTTTYHLSPAVPVMANQCIGWYVGGQGVFPYNNGDSSQQVLFTANKVGFQNVGGLVSFKGTTPRKYSVLSSYVVSR